MKSVGFPTCPIPDYPDPSWHEGFDVLSKINETQPVGSSPSCWWEVLEAEPRTQPEWVQPQLTTSTTSILQFPAPTGHTGISLPEREKAARMCRFPWASAQLGGHGGFSSTWHSRTLAQPRGWNGPCTGGTRAQTESQVRKPGQSDVKASKVKSKRLCQGKNHLRKEGANIWRDFHCPCQVLPYLCLLEISSALGFHPHGTRRRLSRRLSTVTEFRCTTWKPGAIPPRCLSLQDTTKPSWRSVLNKNS